MDPSLTWWQTLPHRMDPFVFELGWFRPTWYGMMYVLAFGATYLLAVHRLRHESRWQLTVEQFRDLLTALIVGTLLGGRLGYVIFYNLRYYLRHPLEIFLPLAFTDQGVVFTGIAGMAYHGALLGVMIAGWLYVRRGPIGFRDCADLLAPVAPLGYTFGRLGNFINGELYGRVTTAAVGMSFPQAPGPGLRHPSQLYEAFFEGLFLFAVLWGLRKGPWPRGAMLAFYLVGYGTVRFFIEFFRQPDEHLGTVLYSLSMGQVLCMLMIIAGAGLYVALARLPDARTAGGRRAGRGA